MKNIKCPVVVMYGDFGKVKNDPVLGEYNLKLAIKQREERIKEEYEAFIKMHDIDGTNTNSKRSREL